MLAAMTNAQPARRFDMGSPAIGETRVAPRTTYGLARIVLKTTFWLPVR